MAISLIIAIASGKTKAKDTAAGNIVAKAIAKNKTRAKVFCGVYSDYCVKYIVCNSLVKQFQIDGLLVTHSGK